MSEPLFFRDPEIPEPPPELSECGPEWRAGYGIGWRTGPALTPDPAERPKIGPFSPFAGKRKRAVVRGIDAGREAKRALVAEHLPAIYHATPLTAVWGGWERRGWLYEDAFFFPYSTSKLPACVPASAVPHSQEGRA